MHLGLQSSLWQFLNTLTCDILRDILHSSQGTLDEITVTVRIFRVINISEETLHVSTRLGDFSIRVFYCVELKHAMKNVTKYVYI